MFRKSSVFRRIPAIIMIQNSETEGAAYLGHFQKTLLNTNLRLVHFKMFNKDHLNLLPQSMSVEAMRDAPLYCTHSTNPSADIPPSLQGTPRGGPSYGAPSFAAVVAEAAAKAKAQQEENAATMTPSPSPSPSPTIPLPSCVMSPCGSECEDKMDYHIVGVISLGGPMSAADDANYPFIRKVMTLMKSAVEEDVPVLGICLGSQMLSRALGGEVTRAPIGEMGFVPQSVEKVASFATPEEAAAAKAAGVFDWFGGRSELLSYHWHNDTFTIPPPAVRIATGPFCANQAFQVPHKYVLGVQWHPDIDNRKAYAWLRNDTVDKRAAEEPLSPGVATCGDFLRSLEDGAKMTETQSLADDIFNKWFEGVAICKAARVAAIGAPNHENRHPAMSPPLEASSVPAGFGDNGASSEQQDGEGDAIPALQMATA